MASYKRVIRALIVANVCIITNTSALDVCYTTDIHPYRYYSDVTRYNDVFPKTPWIIKTACQPIFLYLLVRHGARYPSQKETKRINDKLPIIQEALSQDSASLCQADIDKIKAWTSVFHPSNSKDLADSGKAELYGIGTRFKSMYPDLLKAPFDVNAVTIRHTHKNRTRDSALAFLEAVYNTQDIPMESAPEGNDYLLRFNNACSEYTNIFDDMLIPEYEKFINGPVMSTVIRNVTERLGLEQGRLTYDDVEMIWDACRFEHAIRSESSWCAAFVKSELQVLEYSLDLEEYWQLERGPINEEMTCPLIKDIVKKLRSAEHGHELKVALRFAHKGTMLRLLTKLGLFHGGSPLLVNNMASMKNKKSRVSINFPFAANIGLILYRCADGPYLRVLMNEKPIQMPGCSNSDMCSLSTVLDDSGLQAFADDCNFHEICGNMLNKGMSQIAMNNLVMLSMTVFITALC